MSKNSKQIDWRAVSLAVPAVAYVVGLILYSGNVMVPGVSDMSDLQRFGSNLMVFGAEAGTMSAVVEFYRKHAKKRARAMDWIGTFISLVATLFGAGVAYAKDSASPILPWVTWLRSVGPIPLIVAQVVDFYFGSVMQLGFYMATKRSEERDQDVQTLRDEMGFRREDAILDETIAREKLKTKAMEASLNLPEATRPQPETYRKPRDISDDDTNDLPDLPENAAAMLRKPPESAAEDEKHKMTLPEWRKARDEMNGNAPESGPEINMWLAENGYQAISARTARNWAKS